MPSGQMNFNMRFTADTSQAQNAIQQLQTSLSQIAMAGSGSGVSKGMAEAASAAKELSYHLNQAYNVTTGNFDLSRLDKSLKTSGTNITKLSSQLLQAGQTGQQAFIKLAQSVASADRPMITLSSRMSDLFNTIKNTAKWQISSSIIHGFMGAVQSAYGYAQDLNESLNNIRIVTGYNVDKMSQFAIEANKAAKALSTTTTEYTDASLIYYQQGLNDQQVKERTDVTIKMANVSRQSAETVSDQMTAIWNNFDTGSKSLEYYADVMTALGAATASSSDEIAQGLEKFAAIADTVGLSYEYATTALATVAAETRQSADVVGTAFKTMFARIQGLKLGETLEDGTDFNQYSEALMTVGINIKDANGNLKEMDTILNEMGATWQTLNKDEQVALAQKVAGVRQYSQLIALMDNWDKFQVNLEIAEGSEGTLQEQADIYAESWEAASDRVKASMESIYSDLIDDSFFIDLTNGFAKLLNSLDAFIDGFGGVKMIVVSVASILLSTFANKLPGAIENLKANFNILFNGASSQAQKLSKEFNKVIDNTLADNSLSFNTSQTVSLQNAKLLNEAKNKLLVIQDRMTQKEKQMADQELSIINILEQETQELADQITKRREEINLLKESSNLKNVSEDVVRNAYSDKENELLNRYQAAKQQQPLEEGDTIKSTYDALMQQRKHIEDLIQIRQQYIDKVYETYAAEMDATNGQIENSSEVYRLYELLGESADNYINKLKNFTVRGSLDDQKNGFKEIADEISLIIGDSCPNLTKAINSALDAKNAKDFQIAIKQIQNEIKNVTIAGKDLPKILKGFGYAKPVKDMERAFSNLNKSEKELIQKQDALNKKIQSFNPTHVVTGIEKITAVAGGLGQVAMVAASVRSLFQAWNNDDLSFGEKLTTTFMSLSMIVPAAIGAFKSFNNVLGITTGVQNALIASTILKMDKDAENLAIMTAEEIAKEKHISLDTARIVLSRAKMITNEEEIQSIIKKIGAEEGLTAAEAAEKLASMAGITVDQAKIVIDKMSAGATLQQAMAEAGLTGAKKTGTLATIAQTVAQWALNASLRPTLVLVLAIGSALITLIAGLAGVALIIAGLVIGFKALSDAYNADAIAAQQAAETAKELGEAYDQAASKYQQMIDTMSEYEEARKSLSELTKGTEEYQKALNEANRAALELIQNNPGQFTKGKDYDWEGDQLVFKSGALDQAKQAAKDQENAAYSAKMIGQAKADKAQAKSDSTDLTRKIQDELGVGIGDQFWKNLLTGGQMSDYFAGLASDYAGTVKKALDEYQSDPNLFVNKDEMARKLEIDPDGDLANKLFELKDSLIQVGEDTKAASEMYKLATEEAVKELLGDNENVQNSENKEAIESRSSEILDKAYEKELTNLENENWGGEKTDQNQAWKDYAKEAGLGSSTFVGTSKTDDGRILYEYLDAEGESRKVSLDAMRELVANSKANKTTEDTANKLVQTTGLLDSAIVELKGKGDNTSALAAEGAKAALLGDYSNFTGNELANLGAMDPEQVQGYIESAFGDNWEEQLNQLGFSNAQEYMNAFSDGIKNAQELYNNALSTLGENSPLKSLAEGSSFDTVQNLANQVSHAENVGEGNGQAFQQNISDIVSTVDTQNQGAALEALANIDWSSLEAPQEAIDSLNQLGISSEETEEKINSLKGEMRELNGVDLNDLNTQLDSDVDVEEYENLAKHLQSVADASEDLSDDLKYNEKAAKKTSEAILRFDKAIQKVNDNYEDWSDTLESGSIQDQAKVVGEVRDAYADMLDIDMGSLSDDFVTNADNLELMKQAANGSEEAYNQLQEAARQDIAAQVGLDDTEFQNKFDNLMNKYYEGQNLDDLEIGANLNDEGFLNELSNMVNAANMTAQEATDYLASMGVDAEVETVTTSEPVKKKVNDIEPHITYETGEATILAPDGNGTTQVGISVPKVTMETKQREIEDTVAGGGTSLKVTSASKSSGGGFKYKNSHNGGGTGGGSGGKKGGSGGGGSGGKSSSPAEKKEKTKKTDVVDRYKEITDSLDDLTRSLDKANKKADNLFGPGKIKALRETNKLLKKQSELLGDQIEEAKDYLTIDKKALKSKAAGLGANLTFDKSGNVTNYTEEMSKIFNQLSAAEDVYNSLGTKEAQEEYEESTLKPLEDKIKALQEALAQYEETRELIEDLKDQQWEIDMEIQENRYQIISYTIEVRLDYDQNKLEYLDYLLEKLEDKSHTSAQEIYLLGKQVKVLTNEAGFLSKELDTNLAEVLSSEEIELFKNGKIGEIDWDSKNIDESFMDNIQNIYDNLMNVNEQLLEIQRTVNEMPTTLFEEWSEEFKDQQELLDHYDSVYESYQNIIDLAGKERLGMTTEEIAAIDQARVDNANRNLKASKEYYDSVLQTQQTYNANLADARTAYKEARQNYKKDKTAENKEIMDSLARDVKSWEDALESVDEDVLEAENDYLDKWQTSLEVARDAFLKNCERQVEDLEKKMSGAYGSLEAMQEAFDRSSTQREQYLQEYQKIYELTKLNRDLSKKMDETTNLKAKRELASLQAEILEYQKEGKQMSEYDLQYLQKRYDLKVAEIALEEAQNAKSQVRLTRDSTGNYSYTYTADENNIAEASQSYEDKLYEIINLSNDYVQQSTSNLLSVQQEFTDALSEINEKAANGYFATDEAYQAALEETKEYYKSRIEYFAGEIDKASQNNINVYNNEYSQYEGFIGGKIALDNIYTENLTEEAKRAQEKYLEIETEYKDRQAELKKQREEGIITSEEEYNKKMAELEKEFSGKISQAEADVKAANSGFITDFTSTFLPELSLKYDDATDYATTWSENVGSPDDENSLLGKMSLGYEALEDNIDTSMGNAGTSTENFKNDASNYLDSITNKSKQTANSLNNLAKAANFKKAIANIKDWQENNSKYIGKIIADNEKAIESILKLQNTLVKKTEKEQKKTLNNSNSTTDNKDNTSTKDNTTTSTADKVNKSIEGIAAVIWMIGDNGGWYSGKTREARLNEKGGAGFYNKVQDYINKHAYNGDIYNAWNGKTSQLRNYYYDKFDTGGYTGEWGDSGKLAMLHEKELVLNKEDTENMLNIVSIVRDLINTLDVQSKLANLSQLSLINQGFYMPKQEEQKLEQQVTITAEFPNVQDRNEIEEAFKNIVNRAAQFANRK